MDTGDTQKSPLHRPGFILAAAAIAVILVLGVVLAVTQMNKPKTDAGTVPAPATTAAARPSSPGTAQAVPEDSVCGLKQGKLEGALSKAPATEWKYLGASAYPSSSEYGPGAAGDGGYLHCFQRSPEGAVFAAANAVVQGSQPNSDEWLDYFLAETPGREAAMSEAGSASETSDVRLQIQGFRLLSYTGSEASVDIAARVTPDGQSILGSMVYDLKWEAGDWKLVVQDDGTLSNDLQIVPDLAGYVSWRE